MIGAGNEILREGRRVRMVEGQYRRSGDSGRIGASLLLLAGGRGLRMGGNKLFLAVDGRPVLDFFLSSVAPLFAGTVLCVGAGECDDARRFLGGLGDAGVVIASDRLAGRGPLEGLRQGLAAMATEWGFLLGVDMLTVREAVIRQMWAQTPLSADVCAFFEDKRPNALHAFYRRTCVPHIDAQMASGERTRRGGAKIISFFGSVHVHRVTPADLSHLPGYARSFENFNSPEDLSRL